MIDPRQEPLTKSAKRRVSLATTAALSILVSVALAGCGSGPANLITAEKPEIDPKLGVAPSPRVAANGEPVPKGGGRRMVGKPYTIAGKRYVPKANPSYQTVGLASWYGAAFHGRKTANGEIFDSNHLSAAHPTMPLPSYARVTSLATGRSVVVRVNDRGPFHGNRIIDVSRRTAELLAIRSAGVGKVKVEYIGPAPVDGDDTEFLMASYNGPGTPMPAGIPEIMTASASPTPDVAVPGVSVPAVASAAPAAPAAAVSVVVAALPPARPIPADGGFVTVAFSDPADAFLSAAPRVQVASLATSPQTLGVIPASYQPPSKADRVLAPRSSYAAERVNAAYASVDEVGHGVALSELAARLEALSARPSGLGSAAAADPDAVLEIGVFGNPENAARIAAALAGIGKVSTDEVPVNGQAMKRVRLSGLAVTVDEAVAAAERAGATGIRINR